MTGLDFSAASLRQLCTHHVGNRLREEGLILSEQATEVLPETMQYVMEYFLSTLKSEEVYSFTHPVQLHQNDVFAAAEQIFSQVESFLEQSQNLARLLYEYATHPKVISGELNVALFDQVQWEGKELQAVGIFKSEKQMPFLKMHSNQTRFSINHDFGFTIDKIDKACIIFNTQKIDGYRVLVLDNANRSEEAKYWKTDFLKIKPIANEFHQTQQFMTITRDFVTQKLDQEFPVTKADKIDLMNRSVDYFKTHDSFDKQDFEESVLQDKGMIHAFRQFDSGYRESNNLELTDTFDISMSAVKKQARVFKSVLKLDKNFHIYIHGNRELIEQGVDADGRKFYKVYYDQEF